MPALVGPLIGPPLGGAIATFADWRWIFFINIPIGILGMALAQRFLPVIAPIRDVAFDWPGFALSGLACAGVVFGLSVISLPALPPVVGIATTLAGAIFAVLYVRHSRRTEHPVVRLDLFRIATLRASIVGGGVFRIGAGAVPFLFPLMLQLGAGYTAFQSGLVSAVSIGGAMTTKAFIKPILKRFGFRPTLIFAALVGGVLIAAIAAYRPDSSIVVLVLLLLVGGFFRSMFFTGVNTLAFADVPHRFSGDATSMLAAFQQIAIAGGVATAGAVLEAGIAFNGTGHATLNDFTLAFLVVGTITVFAAWPFLRLSREAGAELAGRRVPAE